MKARFRSRVAGRRRVAAGRSLDVGRIIREHVGCVNKLHGARDLVSNAIGTFGGLAALGHLRRVV